MSNYDDGFFVKEVALSALKGMAHHYGLNYRLVFHSPDGEMESAKGFDGLAQDGKYYEMKLTRKRTPFAREDYGDFEGPRDTTKQTFMVLFREFVRDYYPLLRVETTKNNMFISHCAVDYEITFVEKRGVKL